MPIVPLVPGAASRPGRYVANKWPLEHGERVPPHLRAGCHEPIADARTLDLADGCRVHDDTDYACLLRYGQKWRGAAARALEEASCWSREHTTAEITEFPPADEARAHERRPPNAALTDSRTGLRL